MDAQQFSDLHAWVDFGLMVLFLFFAGLQLSRWRADLSAVLWSGVVVVLLNSLVWSIGVAHRALDGDAATGDALAQSLPVILEPLAMGCISAIVLALVNGIAITIARHRRVQASRGAGEKLQGIFGRREWAAVVEGREVLVVAAFTAGAALYVEGEQRDVHRDGFMAVRPTNAVLRAQLELDDGREHALEVFFKTFPRLKARICLDGEEIRSASAISRHREETV
jgi:hypothetical protein